MIQPREKNHWDVQLQDVESGAIVAERVSAYWDPAHDSTPGGVAGAAQAQAFMASNRKSRFQAVAVTLA